MSEGDRYYKDMPEADFPVDITFRKVSHPGVITGLHWHEHIQFFYFTEGAATVRCGTELLPVSPGDLVIVNARELHSWEAVVLPLECTVIRVDFSFLSSRPVDRCQTKFIVPIEHGRIIFHHLVRNDPALTECVVGLSEEYGNCRFGYELAVKEYLYRLLRLLLRGHVMKCFSPQEQKERDRNNRRLTAVFRYIDANLGDKIQLEKLADIAEVSTYHLCKLFRNKTGMTIIEYVNILRVEKASSLLHETRLSVTDIAYECGVFDSNYFSRLFRKHRGLSPKAYRRARLSQNHETSGSDGAWHRDKQEEERETTQTHG